MTAVYKEYAEALFILARENDECDAILHELEEVQSIMASEPEYMDFLSCPSIANTERTDAICDAFAGFSEHVVSFLCILCERGRIRELDECIKEYNSLYDALAKTKTAKVYSSVELTEEQKSALTEKLEKKHACSISLDCHVDTSILGGVIIELDGKILDGSVKSQLHQLKDVISR